MKVCGVICEYDPFHKGHAYHLSRAREITGADYLLCVMSGSMTQRGEPALLSPFTRAEMALLGGADVILQLPYAFAVREAEYFALGGVGILQALQCVDALSFGAETVDLALLTRAAELLESPDEAFTALLKAGLERGLSFAAAQGAALSAALRIPENALSGPNTALALAYLRALLRLQSPIRPVPVLRESAYHSRELQPFPSASALRSSILRGDWQGVRRAVPEASFPALERAFLRGESIRKERMDAVMLRPLLTMDPKCLSALPGVDEGLENRIFRALRNADSPADLIERIKTRRYTRGRIARALCHGAMGVKACELPQLPAGARILGFRESARPLLRQMQKSGFPLITRPAGESSLEWDLRADALWSLGAMQPIGDTYRRGPVIVKD